MGKIMNLGWQTFSLKKTFSELKPENFDIQEPLAATDVTLSEATLAEEFLPDVTLKGLELQAERKSPLWGGFYFRVLSDDSNKKRCIQYLYIWTYQKWFLSFWFSVLPAVFLAICAQIIDIHLVNRFLPTVLIGLLFSAAGFLCTVKRYWQRDVMNFKIPVYISNATWYLFYGLLFLILELSLPSFYETTLTLSFGNDIVLSVTAIVFSLIGFISLVVVVLNPKLPFVSHKMDYAPLYVYLDRYENKWEIDQVRYDSFHYECQTDRYDVLQGSTDDGKRVKFIIANNWHSFSLDQGELSLLNRIGDLGLGITLLSTIIITAAVGLDAKFPELLLDNSILLIILAVIVILYAASNVRSTYPLVDKNNYEVLMRQDSKKTRSGPINFNDSLFFLTKERILMFWNLNSKGARLKIHKKLQAPFAELDWMSFRD
ncbi:MAG: hypothetical protein ACFFD4_32090 [Candidatus Odinarchaeota archaeon]